MNLWLGAGLTGNSTERHNRDILMSFANRSNPG